MTSSGNSGRSIWRSAALTECTRSRRESISVPSRSKITNWIECGSKARWVRIMQSQNKAVARRPSATRAFKEKVATDFHGFSRINPENQSGLSVKISVNPCPHDLGRKGEDHTFALRAAIDGCSIDGAGDNAHAAFRIGSVGPIEGEEQLECPAASNLRVQAEQASVIGADLRRLAVEIAGAVNRQRRIRLAAVGSSGEAVQNPFGPHAVAAGREFINRSASSHIDARRTLTLASAVDG